MNSEVEANELMIAPAVCIVVSIIGMLIWMFISLCKQKKLENLSVRRYSCRRDDPTLCKSLIEQVTIRDDTRIRAWYGCENELSGCLEFSKDKCTIFSEPYSKGSSESLNQQMKNRLKFKRVSICSQKGDVTDYDMSLPLCHTEDPFNICSITIHAVDDNAPLTPVGEGESEPNSPMGLSEHSPQLQKHDDGPSRMTLDLPNFKHHSSHKLKQSIFSFTSNSKDSLVEEDCPSLPSENPMADILGYK